MQVSEFVQLSGGRVLTGDYEDRAILCGYTCDLLSHVMGKGQADMAWITVQAHMNVIAVAALMDFACVIIPEGLPVDETIIHKAAEEGIVIISCEQTAYELVVLLADKGVPSARKA
ncbi:MAG: AraC family transcriptional regulator [Clostridiales bacterium]|nr:AraC family transcriptional regulator [Clostridiales bacterium]